MIQPKHFHQWGCDGGTQLAPGAACDGDLVFAPTGGGDLSGTLEFIDDSLNETGARHQIQLSGTAWQYARWLEFGVLPPKLLAGQAPGVVTVEVQDNYGYVVNQSTATITLEITGPNSFHQSFEATATAGKASFDLSGIPLTIAGAYHYLAQSPGLYETTGSTTVTAGTTVGGFQVSGYPTTVIGLAHDFTVAITDPYGNTITGYDGFAGTVHFTSSDPAAVLPGDYTFQAADTGVHTFSATLNSAGSHRITVTSGAMTGTQSNIIVLPGRTDFGNVNVGASSETTFSYTFATSVTLGEIRVVAQGVPSLDFQRSSSGGSCTSAQSYNAGDTCTLNVTFSPRFPGMRKGAVLVTDSSGNAVFETPLYGVGVSPVLAFDKGVVTSSFSGSYKPISVVEDAGGNIYLADFTSLSVLKIAPGGEQSTVASGFGIPIAVAVDGAGNVYIADVMSAQVVKVPAGGGAQTIVADASNGLGSPWGIAADGAGNLFIADSELGRIVKLAPGSGVLTTVLEGLSVPSALAVDSSGNLYVSDTGWGVVAKVSPAGEVLSVVAAYPAIYAPYGLAVDTADNVYIADLGLRQVLKVTPAGSITTFVDTSAGLHAPFSVGIGGNGNVYVGDFGNMPDEEPALPGSVIRVDRQTSPALDFGIGTSAGTTSAAQTVTLSNIGNQRLDFTALSVPAHFVQQPSGATDCAGTTQLLSNENCAVAVAFAPRRAGSLSGLAALSTNAFNSPHSLAMSGTASIGSQAITFDPLPTVTYGIAPIYLNATASSALPVSYSVSGPATLTGSVLMVTGAGEVIVTATQEGDSSFFPATPVERRFTVRPATLTVAAADASMIYGGALPALTPSYIGFVNGDSESVLAGSPTLSTTATSASAAGTYAITIEVGSLTSANYTFAFVNGTLTVTRASLTVVPDDQTRTYGGANPTLTGTVTGIQNSDPIAVAYSTVATPGSPVGSYAITATINDPGNKLANYAVTNPPGTLTITPASLTVVPDGQTRTYGGANPTLTGTVSGIQNSDPIAVAYSTVATPGSPVGSYTITATINDPGNKLANYAVTNMPGTLTVTPAALTVTVADASRVYGMQNPGFTGIIAGLQNNDPITPTYSTAATASSGVGTYAITATLNDAGNKLANYAVINTPGMLTITAASTTTTLEASSTNTLVGTSVTFTATIGVTTGTGIPVGTITFKDGAATLGTGTIDATGKATYSTSGIGAGSHSITAAFGGTPNFTNSTSASLSVNMQDFSPPATFPAIALLAGQTKTAVFTITPVSGFTGTITFSCVVPTSMTEASCSASPVQITGASGADSTLTVVTNGSRQSAANSHCNGWYAANGLMLLAFAWLGAPALWRRRRVAVLTILLIVLLIGGAVSCGGGSSSSKHTDPGTPAGTYALTINATSGTAHHTMNVTVIVQ